MGILVLTTGGTIGALPYPDPAHPPQIASMPTNGRDPVREMFTRAEFDFARISSVSLEQCDSGDIDEIYLQTVLAHMHAAAENEILLTHGTDRILQSAEYFHDKWESVGMQGKLLILTGSMTPLANGPKSDGHLNLTFAIKQLDALGKDIPESERTVANGIYIVLCDWEYPQSESGAWLPRLYRFEPGRYRKQFNADGRYNRIVDVYGEGGKT